MGFVLSKYFLDKLARKVMKRERDPEKALELLEKAQLEGETYEIKSGKKRRVLITYQGITFFCVPLKAKKLPWEEIIKEIRSLPFWRAEVFLFGKYLRVEKKELIKILLNEKRSGEYYFWEDLSKMQIYVGEDPPLMVYALRVGGGSPIARGIWSMAIKKKYAKKIFRGEKKWEIRKIVPVDMKEGDVVYVYVPKPIKAFVGTFEVGKVIREEINKLWELVGKEAGVDKREFFEYYNSKYWKEGVAIEIKNPKPFDVPVYLEEIRKLDPEFISPQNIMKVDERYVALIEHALFKKRKRSVRDSEGH